jgi:cold shock CspA family protein
MERGTMKCISIFLSLSFLCHAVVGWVSPPVLHPLTARPQQPSKTVCYNIFDDWFGGGQKKEEPKPAPVEEKKEEAAPAPAAAAAAVAEETKPAEAAAEVKKEKTPSPINPTATTSSSDQLHKGKCKWFDAKKGYGFITPNSGGEDIFVHQSQLHKDGFRSLRNGEEVEYMVGHPDKGREQAIRVTGPGGAQVRGS